MVAQNVPPVDPLEAVVPTPDRRRRGGAIANLLIAVVRSPKALIGAVILAIFVLMALLAPIIAPHDPTSNEFERAVGPSAQHLLGTTAYGGDVFSQMVFGSRQSLLIAFLIGAIATAISALIGVAAAYIGNLPDHIISLVTDIFLVLPGLPLLIVISSYIRSSGIMVMVLVVALTSWAYGARQFRAQGLALRNREFLEAARVRGERTWYTIVFEILPTMTGLLVANFLGAAVYGLIAVVGLQFIGLGDISTVSWGSMMRWAHNNEALQAGAPLWELAPGVCIGLLGASITLLNYAFDEVSNPALRPPRRRVRRKPSRAVPETAEATS